MDFSDVSSVGKVKSLSPNRRFVIALHSPDRIDETGLPQFPPEKKAPKLTRKDTAGHFLRSRFSEEVVELRRFLPILGELQPGFSATKTEWRRGGIRTPDTGVSPYNGLANLYIRRALNRINALHAEPGALKWGSTLSFGNKCSPLCSPLSQLKQGTDRHLK
jgi:hypothetical protein